ncbi:MAG: response regulator [Phycisphaeraceae bacterium]
MNASDPLARGASAQKPVVKSSSDAGEIDLTDSTILIVDDNQQNLELLQAYLEGLPCRIVTATDGLEALAAVEREEPDVILLDVMMPRMSGFEVCKKLKSDPATRAIPIIMVTALNELGDVERGVESGTDDFVSKPVKKLELVTRVKSLLRFRHLKRELNRTLADNQQQGDQDDSSSDR